MTPTNRPPRPATTWILLSGEYSPQPGGVADYSFGLANALAGQGDVVHVLASGPVEEELPHGGDVRVHRLPYGFHPRGLPALQRKVASIRRQAPQSILLVQYVPHAFGRWGINVAFAAWVAAQSRAWIVFHEVAFDGAQPPLKERFLGAVQRLMARLLGRRAEKIFVTIPAWDDLLRSLGVRRPIETLPVPSNVPQAAPPDRVEAVRQALGNPQALVGHFGTFGERIATPLAAALRELTGHRDGLRVLLVGRGSQAFLQNLLADHPSLTTRITATGGLPPEEVAVHLSACDVLLQPYPDGLSCRRGTLMAGLALGKPVVSNLGWLSEGFWAQSPAVCLAPDPDHLAQTATALLDDPERQRALGLAAREAYAQGYSMESLVAKLMHHRNQ